MRRSLPHLVLTAALLALTSACSDEAADVAESTPSPSASPSTSASPSGSAEPAPTPTCEPFPTDLAQTYVLDVQRETTPAPTKAVSVETRLTGQDVPVYVVAFDLGDKSVALAHPVTDGEGPTGNGPYVALSSYTAEVTGKPQDEALRNALGGDAVSTALGCLAE